MSYPHSQCVLQVDICPTAVESCGNATRLWITADQTQNVSARADRIGAVNGPRQCGNTRRGPDPTPVEEVWAVDHSTGSTSGHAERALEFLSLVAKDCPPSFTYYVNLARKYGVTAEQIIKALCGEHDG